MTAGWAGWGQLEGGVRDSEEARRRPLLRGTGQGRGRWLGAQVSGCLCPGGANSPNGFIKPLQTHPAPGGEEMHT